MRYALLLLLLLFLVHRKFINRLRKKKFETDYLCDSSFDQMLGNRFTKLIFVFKRMRRYWVFFSPFEIIRKCIFLFELECTKMRDFFFFLDNVRRRKFCVDFSYRIMWPFFFITHFLSNQNKYLKITYHFKMPLATFDSDYCLISRKEKHLNEIFYFIFCKLCM